MRQKFNFFLYFSAISVNLFFITLGCMLVWTSPVLPKLQSNDTSINPLKKPISLLQISILTSINPLASALGTILTGKIPDLIGRKRTIQYLSLILLTAFFGLFFANEVYVFYICLTIISTVISAGSIVVPIYTAEIAEDHNRGTLGYFLSTASVLGQLYAFTIGSVTNVNLFSLLCGAPIVLLFIFSYFIPESPVYLLLKGNKDEAIQELKKLGKFIDIDSLELIAHEKHEILKQRNDGSVVAKNTSIKKKSVKKAIILSIAVISIQNLAGMHIVLGFLGTLLNDVTTSLSGNTLAIIVIVFKLFSNLVGLNIIDKIGRRFLLLLAIIICGISMLLLGIFFYFKENDYILSQPIKLLPVLFIIIFVVMYTFGLTSVPFILKTELLPDEIRSLGCSIAQLVGNLLMFATAFIYPMVAEYLGVHYCMFTFSFFCFSGFIGLYIYLPETKGKSFLEIENILSR
ncbi:facilitated trehalose transporter Tret1-like [Diabrotica undecimpunctata]|uniref:facilitated trehalose transporter Tret1-like n=1 Tax=Diabrotica undecimpunctata TaxID=50387 RepID=UPI003B63425E